MRKRNLLKNVTGKKRNFGGKAFLMVVIFFLTACMTTSILTSANTYNAFNRINLEESQNIKVFNTDTMADNVKSIDNPTLNKKSEIRLRLIDEVKNYMDYTHPKHRMNPEYIVDACLKNNYDIPLLLAQAETETGFGSAGAGRSRNSCFGVVKKRYGTTNDAVDDYIRMMQKSYLPKGRTINQLFNSGFRTTGGYKYAASTSYAIAIKNNRNKIINKTDIQHLHTEYNSLDQESKIES